MKYFSLAVCFITTFCSFAQISDDFTDGDFTSGTVWSGTDIDYQINGALELQLNNTVAATSYLSAAHGLSDLDDKEWKLYTRQSFSPSGGNFGRIYLTSTSADLTSDPDGFYLQLGEAGSNDAVRLFKCDGGIHTELLAGTLAQIATSFAIGIRVVRDNLGNWDLYVDPTGGENFSLEGTTNDATVLLGTHFGFLDTYTASNSTGFYYDNIYVGNEILDLTPPLLSSATALTATTVDVQFDEALDQASAENIGNYNINLGISVLGAMLDGGDPTLVHLTTSTLLNGQTYTLSIDNIMDLAANNSGAQNTDFTYLIPDTPAPGDVVINEFMCDPTPQVGLAEVEYVEVYNVSTKIFDVNGWKIGDASSDGTIQAGILLPGEYMVLTSTSNVDSFTVATAVTSFPSLNNAGDNIVLRDGMGVDIDSISYTSDWYNDNTKESGGYSIERINPGDPCTDVFDWMASQDPLGGSPGEVNSVYDPTPDIDGPSIAQLIALPPNYLEIYFNEGMDSTSLADGIINVNPALTIANRYILGPNPSMMTLEFVEALTGSQTYAIELQLVADCWLNPSNESGFFALPEVPNAGEIVVNEVLFNPLTGGYDWVELYNTSDKLFDLFNMSIANFDNDTIANIKPIEEHYLLYPDSYVILAEDSSQVSDAYPQSYIPGQVVEMDIPNYSNDSGTVYIQLAGITLDKVSYLEDWHFKLLDDTDGKSLERIDPNGESESSYNWHTAAEAVGFATPGGENSQYNLIAINGEFEFASGTVSPDNDGFEDVLTVNYTMIEGGLVGSFTVYDDRGRLIARVMESELLGSEGTFTWDGIRDDNTKSSIGTYVGVFEAHGIDGGLIFTQRKAFTVVGKI